MIYTTQKCLNPLCENGKIRKEGDGFGGPYFTFRNCPTCNGTGQRVLTKTEIKEGLKIVYALSLKCNNDSCFGCSKKSRDCFIRMCRDWQSRTGYAGKE